MPGRCWLEKQPDTSPALTPRLFLHGDFIARTEKVTKARRSCPLAEGPGERDTLQEIHFRSVLAVSDFFCLEGKYFVPQGLETLVLFFLAASCDIGYSTPARGVDYSVLLLLSDENAATI